jgi:hypothetical protein
MDSQRLSSRGTCGWQGWGRAAIASQQVPLRATRPALPQAASLQGLGESRRAESLVKHSGDSLPRSVFAARGERRPASGRASHRSE